MSVLVYVEITCEKCARYISHTHVRYAKDFTRLRKQAWDEAQVTGAIRDKAGRVTCIRCLTPKKDWPLSWY